MVSFTAFDTPRTPCAEVERSGASAAVDGLRQLLGDQERISQVTTMLSVANQIPQQVRHLVCSGYSCSCRRRKAVICRPFSQGASRCGSAHLRASRQSILWGQAPCSACWRWQRQRWRGRGGCRLCKAQSGLSGAGPGLSSAILFASSFLM